MRMKDAARRTDKFATPKLDFEVAPELDVEVPAHNYSFRARVGFWIVRGSRIHKIFFI